MVNFTGEFFELTATADVFYILLWIVAAILVTVLWGPSTLTQRLTPVGPGTADPLQ